MFSTLVQVTSAYLSRGWHKLFRAAFMLGLLAANLAQAAPQISRSSGVLFNTICAQCHEGECSGRLSFESGQFGADAHIRRYVGDVPETMVAELFSVLSYTKHECAVYPLAVPVPADGSWSQSMLADLSTPSQCGYFVPLGALPQGEYQVDLTAAALVDLRVEVIAADFELLLDELATLSTTPMQFILKVSTPVSAYLRVVAREQVILTGLQLRRIE